MKIKNTIVRIVNDIPDKDLTYIENLIDNDLLSRLEESPLEILGFGIYGTVYGYKKYAIKYIHTLSQSDRSRKLSLEEHEEFETTDEIVLKDLQDLECSPKLYATVKHKLNRESVYLIMSRVDGFTVAEFENNMKKSIGNIFISEEFNKTYEYMLADIVSRGYFPYDLHKRNVMIDRNTGLPIIIDVGLFEEIDNTSYYSDKSRNCSIAKYCVEESVYWICNTISHHIRSKVIC